MMVDKRLLEALDACRPGSDDLAQPELADAAAELQRDPELARAFAALRAFDAKISAVIDEVPVPTGLAERILHRLAQEVPADGVSEAIDEPAPSAPQVAVAPTASEPRLNRRRWWVATAALAASIAAATTLALRPEAEPPLTADTVQEFAQRRYEQLLESEAWRPLSAAPSGYPKSTRVATQAWRWQPLSTSVDRRAVAYDLTPRGAQYRATLMVIRAPVPGLTTIPQKTPLWTQGRLISAWRQGDLLYVLVLDAPPGGSRNLPQRYRQMVDTSPGLVG